MAKELQDFEIPWFYSREVTPAASSSSAQAPADANVKDAKEAKKPPPEWKALSVGDSLKLEIGYRSMVASTATTKVEIVSILNDLYDVNVGDRLGYPVFWNGPAVRVLR